MKGTQTRRDFWLSILKRCGGRASAKDLASMAMKLNPEELREVQAKAVLKAYQADARNHLNELDDDGTPVTLRHEEYVLDENGQEVAVEVFVQMDLCEQRHWEFTVRTRMSGIRGNAKKLRKLIDWGINQWPGSAKRAFRKIENEFGFILDDVAGEDDEDQTVVP